MGKKKTGKGLHVKMYKDSLSNPAKEISKISVDIIKAKRLFLMAPIQIAAAFQDRFEELLDRVVRNVPEERLVQVPVEVLGPAMDKMKYLPEETPLWEMFEELITRSADSEEVVNVHPAFTHIISQLSHDEAIILYKLRENDFEIVDTLDLDRATNKFGNLRIEKSDIPTKELFLPNKVNLYYSHLESLSLVTWPVYKQDPIKDDKNVQIGTRRYSKMQLSEFGKLFVTVCVPPRGFKNS